MFLSANILTPEASKIYAILHEVVVVAYNLLDSLLFNESGLQSTTYTPDLYPKNYSFLMILSLFRADLWLVNCFYCQRIPTLKFIYACLIAHKQQVMDSFRPIAYVVFVITFVAQFQEHQTESQIPVKSTRYPKRLLMAQ